MRYGWPLLRTPTHCACGFSFSVKHCLPGPKSGLPSIQHTEIGDFTAGLLTEICPDISVEPELQPISTETFRNLSSNTQDETCLDIAMNGFWGGQSERAFVDVKVFNPYAPSNSNLSTTSCYKKHENIKEHVYEQRLREVEHSSFMPLILSATGGMAPEAAVFTRLASQLASKWNDHYSITMGWLRCSLSYSLL